MKHMRQKVLIYCRVSTRRQLHEGSGLTSQEKRCRIHAEQQGYEIEAVFPDDVTGSGNFMDRKGMVAMLEHIKCHPNTSYVVIFDDLKRLARDTKYYLILRETLDALKVRVECLNFTFEASPEGEFYETVIAAGGQLERKQNARQVQQKVSARFEAGYWGLAAPLGYKMQMDKKKPRILIRDEPIASYIQEALEGFACGRFQTQSEVARFLETCPEFPRTRNKGRQVHRDLVKKLLTKSVYAGMVELKCRGIGLREGHHEGLITMTTYQKIQNRLNGKTVAPTRKDLNQDFVLRGAVCCTDCNNPLTANWSSGRNKKYPYYLCRTKGCVSYGKSILREKMESQFETLLKQLTPAKSLMKTATKMFKSLWDNETKDKNRRKQDLQKHIKQLDREKEKIIDKLIKTDIESVIAAYEKRIQDIELDKVVIEEKLSNLGKESASFDKNFRTAKEFLSNPYRLWDRGQYLGKRAVLKLAFPQHLIYDRKTGFRTAAIARPFRLLEGLKKGDSEMAEREGFEPSIPFTVYSLSRGAPSATRPSLRSRCQLNNYTI